MNCSKLACHQVRSVRFVRPLTMTTRRWAFTLNTGDRSRGSIPRPFSSVDDSKLLPERPRKDDERLERAAKLKAAWGQATSWKGMFIMYAILYFFIPNSPSIYTISFAMYALLNPLRAAFTFNSAFKPFEHDIDKSTISFYKIIFVLGHLFFAGVASYKLMKLGFLPVTDSDWIYFYGIPKYIEQSFGGAAYS